MKNNTIHKLSFRVSKWVSENPIIVKSVKCSSVKIKCSSTVLKTSKV